MIRRPSLALVLLMNLTALAGCGDGKPSAPTPNAPADNAPPAKKMQKSRVPPPPP